MRSLNEELVLEYLIENLDKESAKNYPLKTSLMLDYCYKTGESIPQDWFSGFTSKVLSKSENKTSKPVSIDEASIKDCLFLESYESMLSESVKGLILNARTAQDFKAITAIEVLCKNAGDYNLISGSSQNLSSKVFNLAKRYKESKTKKEIDKDYYLMREYSLKLKEKLKVPFRKGLAGELIKSKSYLDERLKHYNKYLEQESGSSIKNIIMESSRAIDKKFNDYLSSVDMSYHNIKRDFEDNAWNNEKRINKLVFLMSELEDLRVKYELVSYKKGVQECNLLDNRMKEIIHRHNYAEDLKEELQEVKRKVSEYYKEVDSVFSRDINHYSIQKLNTIYDETQKLSNKIFPDYIPPGQQEEYYSRLDKFRIYLKQKCARRAQYIIDKCSKYRQKVNRSFFSWQTRKYVKELGKYDQELEVWSRCQAV